MVVVEDYIKGISSMVTDAAIANLLTERSIEAGTDVSELTKRERDLLKADTYIWLAASPTTGASISDADGNWSHKEGSVTMSAADKRLLRRMAYDIYALYGESVTSSIKVMAGGMTLW